MRLLHTQTLEVSEFNDEASRPYYAILSHTWADDEFIFSDFAKPDRRSSSGWRKILKCCELAAADGWEYAWVDTCCIDKSSSAELTEAINSMWTWYRDSQICYVHLADCSIFHGLQDLPNSRWFTRGWTLQELLAPERVVFYDADWQELGSRSYLQQDISHICRIAPSYLTTPTAASVATKMSWASRRQTTREEDLAYSLLGLFDINMSLIYGEGSKAFFRLQSEIIRSSTDQSIFAWALEESVSTNPNYFQATDMLAPRLSCFAKSDDIVPKHFQGLPQNPYQMTNRGLQIECSCVDAFENQHHSFSENLESPTGKTFYYDSPGFAIRNSSRTITQKTWWKPPPQTSGLWLIMLPCVRSTDDTKPIALVIWRSDEGIFTRATSNLIFTFKKNILPERSSSRFEIMGFLVANKVDSREHRLLLSLYDIRGHAFIEMGPILQQKLDDAEKSHPKPLSFYSEGWELFAERYIVKEEHMLFKLSFEGGLRLVIVFTCRNRMCSVFEASEAQYSRLSSNMRDDYSQTRAKKSLSDFVGKHIVTVGDTDDYLLPYKDEDHILVRTRRVFKPSKDGIVKPYRAKQGICCAIRLELKVGVDSSID